jgi:dolichol-phosphate mannosyltransferase
MEQMDENTIEDLAFSFVCIVQNDADRLKPCYDRLKETAEGLGQKYEIIFVNDGSADGSLEGIRALAKLDGSVKYVDFSRAFGRSAAMAAAHDYADGQAVITLSSTAAMVECIPQLVAKWQAGAEMVYTVSDPAAGPEAADVAAACLLDRKVVSAIRGAREAGPKADGLLAWIGFKTAAVPCKDGSVSEPPRRVAARRGIVAAMRAAPSPLRLAAWTGALMLLAGAGCLAVGGALASLGWGGVRGYGGAASGRQRRSTSVPGRRRPVGGVYPQTGRGSGLLRRAVRPRLPGRARPGVPEDT